MTLPIRSSAGMNIAAKGMPNFLSRRQVLIGAAGIGAAWSLAACSPDGGSPAGSGEVVFVQALASGPAHLNPAITQDTAGIPGFAVYEALVDETADFQIVPSLAKEWTVSPDGLSMEFRLQEGVKWHDGTAFTSKDVKYTIENVMKFQPVAGVVAGKIASVATPTETVAVLTLSQPVAMILEALSMLPILPEHLYGGTDVATNANNMSPVGTGPFVFQSYESGDRITLTKNPNYWGDAGKIDKIIFAITPDPSARVLALQSGQIDRISPTDLDPAQVQQLGETDKVHLSSDGTPPIAFMLFANGQDKLTSDVRVREALYRAIDRKAIAEQAWSGAVAATGILPEQVNWAYSAQPRMDEKYPYDPQAASKLLDVLGYTADSNGHRFDINIDFGSGYSTWRASAEIIQANLAKVGVKANLVANDLSVFSNKVYKKHDFQLAVMQGGIVPDPNLGIARQYVPNPDSRPFSSPTQVADDQVSAAFASASVTNDRQKRAQALKAAGERVSELLYTMPLVMATPPSAVSSRWGNVSMFEKVQSLDFTKLTPNS